MNSLSQEWICRLSWLVDALTFAWRIGPPSVQGASERHGIIIVLGQRYDTHGRGETTPVLYSEHVLLYLEDEDYCCAVRFAGWRMAVGG